MSKNVHVDSLGKKNMNRCVILYKYPKFFKQSSDPIKYNLISSYRWYLVDEKIVSNFQYIFMYNFLF